MEATLDLDKKKVSEKDPVEALFDQAEQFELEIQLEEAKNSYQKLLNYDLSETQRFDVYKNLGNVYLKMMDLNLAEGCYCKAAVIFPKNSILKVNMGVLEIQKGNLEKAKANFIEALELDQKNDTGWMGLALVHRSYSDFELSTACCLKALDINPENKTALIHLAKWSEESSSLTPILPFKNYLKNHPNDVEILKVMKNLEKGKQ